MTNDTVKTLILSANLLQALPLHLWCCGSRFRSFQAGHTLQDTVSSTHDLWPPAWACDYSASCRIAEVVWLQKLCNMWRIKARQILFFAEQKFVVYTLKASRCVRFQKEEGIGEGKGKPEGNGEKLWGLCVERFVRKSDKTEKFLSASAKQIRPHKVIARHWLLQRNPEGTDLLQTRLRETEMKLKMNLS